MGFMSNKRGRSVLLAAILSLALLWGGGAGYGMAAETATDATASRWSQLWQSIIDSLRWTEEAIEAEDSVAVPYTGDPLPTLADAAHLRLLLEENGYTAAGYDLLYPELSKRMVDMSVTESVADAAPAAMDNAGSDGGEQSARSAANAEYSELNTQVAGVDEADIVRTDGDYIYRVRASQNKIDIIKALPADDMQYMAGIDFSNRDFSPQELYVDGHRLVVIGTTWRQHHVKPQPLLPEAKMMSYHYPVGSATCRVIIYDLSALPAVTEVRTVEIEGDYLSSRKVDANIYVLTNKHLDYFHIMDDEAYNPNPSVFDTAAGSDWRQLDYREICYFPTTLQPNYLVTAAFSLDKPEQPADIQTYLGGGNNIYASRSYLYVALSSYDFHPEEQAARDRWWGGGSDQITHIYRFALGDAAMTYAGEGSAPGHILNQFSMDEDKGYFRLCTTRGNIWSEGEKTSKNNVYVLDADLKIVGAVEDIAPGEKIYSARFMGDRAYMVTFRTVDPLFVLDLSNPAAPAILGQLKIPGYSDYLHPYDQNHIIGFGKDSVTYKEGAYYLGMKLALFDVSDPAHPIELCKAAIGDRGTESPLLTDHKALLFSKDKNLLAFPVTVLELTDSQRASQNAGGFPQYGQFTYQGAYVYNLDPEQGFTLEQRITHISDTDYLKAGDYWYDSQTNIDRILYIGDVLYTISDSEIKATDRVGQKELDSVKF